MTTKAKYSVGEKEREEIKILIRRKLSFERKNMSKTPFRPQLLESHLANPQRESRTNKKKSFRKFGDRKCVKKKKKGFDSQQHHCTIYNAEGSFSIFTAMGRTLVDGEAATTPDTKDTTNIIRPQHEINDIISEEIQARLPNHNITSDKNTLKEAAPSLKSPSYPPQIQRSTIFPKLTLSAFRKPEFAVTLTSSPPNKLLHQDYDLTSSSRVLGHGASSTVRLAKHRTTGKKVAVKCIGKHDILRSYTHRGRRKEKLDECEILLSLKDSHDTIINLLDVYETESEVQLVMEYCAGGELYDAIQRRRHVLNSSETDCSGQMRPFSNKDAATKSITKLNHGGNYTEAQAARIACQLLSALKLMHGRGIVHRDVKPENILLVSGNDDTNLTVKLSDFGLARMLRTPRDEGASSPANMGVSPLTPPNEKQPKAYSQVGSDYYAAPEVGKGNGYGTAVDMYSLGVTLYILLSGLPPAPRPWCGSLVLDKDSSSSSEDDSDIDGIQKYSPVEFPTRQWRHISRDAKNLVGQMLHPDPSCRITAQEALQHKWIVLHLQAFENEALQSPFTSSPKLCSSKLLSSLGSVIPLVSFSSAHLNYLATNLFENKRKVSSSTKCSCPKEGEIRRKRRRSNSNFDPSIVEKSNLAHHCLPNSQEIISMVDLYSQVNNVAAATGFMDENDSDIEIGDNLEIGDVEKGHDDRRSNSSSDQNVCFPTAMRPLSV